MLPESILPFSLHGAALVPHLLTAEDHPWLGVLLDEHERFVGRTLADLAARLREPLPCPAPEGKRRLAVAVLRRLAAGSTPPAPETAVPPAVARRVLFVEAARRRGGERASVLAAAADALRLTPDELCETLFADLPGERRVAAFTPPLSPSAFALRANLMAAQSFLQRATEVRIALHGNARPVVRHALLRGLICVVRARPEGRDGDAELALSGPLALFRRTLLYGRALGELVPLLGWCARFRLRATCSVRGRTGVLELRTGDPILPSEAPRRYDSRVEERFARELRRLGPEWDLVREPEPVRAGDALLFPDFAMVHRSNPARRWLVEIVGFWTPDYLARKCERYRAARLDHVVLCVDETLACGDGDLPPGARLVRYRRHVDAAAVLRVVAAEAP